MAQSVEIAADRLDHLQIGIGAKGFRQEQCLGLGQFQGKGQIVAAVMGIERHEYRAQRGKRQLHHRPFPAVLGKERHVIARAETDRLQATRHAHRPLVPVAGTQAGILVREDEPRLAGRMSGAMVERVKGMVEDLAHRAHQPPSTRRWTPVT